MLKESLPAQASIVIPVVTVFTVSFNIDLPERKSDSFNEMAALLTPTVYNSDTAFMVPNQMPIPVRGVANPGSTISLLVNNVDQSPTPPILAGSDGGWNGFITLGPGQNTVQVVTS